MTDFKGTKGVLTVIDDISESKIYGWIGSCDIVSSIGGSVFATVHPYEFNGITVEQARANAKLIAAAPDLLEALLEIDKDLCVLETTMLDIEKQNPRAEGMTELVKKWRVRGLEAIKKALD